MDVNWDENYAFLDFWNYACTNPRTDFFDIFHNFSSPLFIQFTPAYRTKTYYYCRQQTSFSDKIKADEFVMQSRTTHALETNEIMSVDWLTPLTIQYTISPNLRVTPINCFNDLYCTWNYTLWIPKFG